MISMPEHPALPTNRSSLLEEGYEAQFAPLLRPHRLILLPSPSPGSNL